MLAAKNPATLMPAAPANRQMKLLGAMKTRGYAAFPNHRSHWRIIWPYDLVCRSIQSRAASPYQYPMRKNSGSDSSRRSVPTV